MSATPCAVLVTGGTGFIGSAVVRRLVRAGYDVHVVARATSDLSVLDSLPVTWHEADLIEAGSIRRAMEEVARHASGRAIDWMVVHAAALMRRKQGLVAQPRQAKYLAVVADLARFERLDGRARLVDDHTVAIDGPALRADRILLATGAAPHIPPVPGLATSGYLTSTTALQLQELPPSMIR